MVDDLAVWIVDLDAISAPDLASLESAVATEEAHRAQAFTRERDGLRWLRARRATREILAEQRGVGPRGITFTLSAGGKPAIAGGPHFNVAHSSAVALVAVGTREVGVDVERVRTGLREEQILGRVLGDAAVGRWTRTAPDSRTGVFFDEWVRFEAAVKCRGATIAASFGANVAEGLRVSTVDVGPDYAAAVATAGGAAPTTRRFDWA